MNASRLRELADLLIKREQQYKVQSLLNEVNTSLSNLAGNPQDANIQTKFSDAAAKLRNAMDQMIASFQPAQIRQLEEIGGDRFFSKNLAADVAMWVQENPISPAVTQKKVAELASHRNAFIEDITQIRDRLKKLKIEAVTLIPGTAEVGILLPRHLFNNHLEELVKELKVLNSIFRAFSEVATGSVQPVEIRQISTTDPQFFFGIDPATTAILGAVVAWALSQWKKVEEIRKLRSETRKNDSFSEAEIKEFFDSKIEKTIKEAIDEKVSELLGPRSQTPGRTNETRGLLEWALESILARIERGLTVEIRLVPPPTKQPEAETEADKTSTKTFAEINQIISQLVFPSADKNPVLEIPPPEPERTKKPKDTK